MVRTARDTEIEKRLYKLELRVAALEHHSPPAFYDLIEDTNLSAGAIVREWLLYHECVNAKELEIETHGVYTYNTYRMAIHRLKLKGVVVPTLFMGIFRRVDADQRSYTSRPIRS